MINKKGQALIEFVLILPVFILIVFAFIDAGRIILCKNHLENSMNDVILMVRNNKNDEEIKSFLQNDDYNITFSIVKEEYTKIKLETKLKLITPAINHVLNENVKTERSIINE